MMYFSFLNSAWLTKVFFFGPASRCYSIDDFTHDLDYSHS